MAPGQRPSPCRGPRMITRCRVSLKCWTTPAVIRHFFRTRKLQFLGADFSRNSDPKSLHAPPVGWVVGFSGQDEENLMEQQRLGRRLDEQVQNIE